MKKFTFLFVAISLLSVSSFVSADNTLVLNVDVDETSFDSVGLAANGFGERPGPFNVVGTFESDGTFRCWGWIDEDGVGSVSQVFNIYGRGTIMTQGIEGGLLAVTGGTGDFLNVRGEALQTFNDLTVNLDFTIEFTLRGARGD